MKNKQIFLAITLSVGLLSACNGGSRSLPTSSSSNSSSVGTNTAGNTAASTSPTQPTQGTSVAFETVTKVGVSGIEKAQNLAIQSEAQLKTIWDEHTSKSAQDNPMPEVDFDSETLLAVFMGQKSTGGYQIEIKRVVQSGTKLVVEYEAREPEGDVFITVITAPMHMVKIQKSAADFSEVEFKAL